MTHTSHAMHENSLAAYREEEANLTGRALRVYEWIERNGCVTDREVMRGLGFTDPNAVRPRITELIDAGRLEEVGSRRDGQTGKTVRIVAVKREPEQGEMW